MDEASLHDMICLEKELEQQQLKIRRLEERLDRIEGEEREPETRPVCGEDKCWFQVTGRCHQHNGKGDCKAAKEPVPEPEGPGRPTVAELIDIHWKEKIANGSTETPVGNMMVHHIQSVRKRMKRIVHDTPSFDYKYLYETLKGILDGDEKYYGGNDGD